MLRNGTYVREKGGMQLIYHSPWFYIDPFDLPDLDGFKVVWNDAEKAELYQYLGMSYLEPGQYTEVKGKRK